MADELKPRPSPLQLLQQQWGMSAAPQYDQPPAPQQYGPMTPQGELPPQMQAMVQRDAIQQVNPDETLLMLLLARLGMGKMRSQMRSLNKKPRKQKVSTGMRKTSPEAAARMADVEKASRPARARVGEEMRRAREASEAGAANLRTQAESARSSVNRAMERAYTSQRRSEAAKRGWRKRKGLDY